LNALNDADNGHLRRRTGKGQRGRSERKKMLDEQ
jgi:hypothetical protein